MPSVASHETLVRQLQMLHLIPRSPAQITVADLTAALTEQGYQVTSRTVQRDLNDIASVLPLECNDRSKPYGWKWSREARTHLPMMSLQEALSLHLVQQHLTQLLPPALLDDLMPMFKQAMQTITGLGSKHQLQHWLNSVVVEAPTQPLQAPNIDLDIQHNIYQAVFEQKQLNVRYRALQANEAKDFVLHPLGIVQRGPITYVGGTAKDYEDIRLYALHRFEDAEINHFDPANPQNKQSWQDYLASGAGGFHERPEDKIQLVARIDESLAARLTETPLSSDQQLIANSDGSYQLIASVFDTWQLGWWILSQGESLIVQAPIQLRQQIQQRLQATLAGYR